MKNSLHIYPICVLVNKQLGTYVGKAICYKTLLTRKRIKYSEDVILTWKLNVVSLKVYLIWQNIRIQKRWKCQGIFILLPGPDLLCSPPKDPVQWVPGTLSLGNCGWSMELTTHLHSGSRSKMCRVLPLHPLYTFIVWYLGRGASLITI